MIIFRVRLPLRAGCRPLVVRALRRTLGETRALAGCVSCQLCADVEDANRLVLLEVWSDIHSLRARLRQDDMRVVLSTLDYASAQPEVRFDTIARTQGMEFIAACRQADCPDQGGRADRPEPAADD